MPRLIPVRLAAFCALAIAMSLTFVAAAGAKGFAAELRVVGKGNKTLSEGTVVSEATSVKSSPKATCFGPGSGGSGKSVAVTGTSAMGLLASGVASTRSLRPLLVSDSFDFGLALCGIGGSVAKGGASWYLKINHKAASVSADAARIRSGDEVLFALAESDPKTFAYPDELWLQAPNRVTAGKPFTVRAFSYDEKGKRKPAAGVKVTGARGVTAANGKVTVTVTKPKRLVATKSGLITGGARVCTGPARCPAGS